jgi:hypothetical protein
MMAHIPHSQSYQVARSQLTVDGEVEERQFSGATTNLQSYPDRPDVFQFQRRLLANELPFVPWSLSRRNMN